MAQLAAKMPWCYALDDVERRCFLRLLRKMLDTPSPDASVEHDLPAHRVPQRDMSRRGTSHVDRLVPESRTGTDRD